MKKILFLIALLLQSLFLHRGANSACVQSLNAFGPVYGFFLESRMEKFAEFLLEQDAATWSKVPGRPQVHGFCDLIFLQEVWTERHQAILKENLAPRFKFLHFDKDFHNQDDSRSIYGHALAIYGEDWKILDLHTESFEFNYAGFADTIRKFLGIRKGFSFVALQNGVSHEKFGVIQTHLHHSSEKLRILQLIQIAAFLRQRKPSIPVIILGDFNAEPGAKEIKLFSEITGAQLLEKDHHCTYCKENPYSLSLSDKNIDHMFYLAAGCLTPDYELPSYVYPRLSPSGGAFSDHYGMRVIESFTAEPEQPDVGFFCEVEPSRFLFNQKVAFTAAEKKYIQLLFPAAFTQ